MFLEGQERKYSMMHYAMLMLQLEVNISSSQGFSLVNQTLLSKHQPNLQDYARPVDHNLLSMFLSFILIL